MEAKREGLVVNPAVERRIQEVMRERRVDYYTAAAIVGRAGARRRQRREQQLTALHKSWAWRRDFLD